MSFLNGKHGWLTEKERKGYVARNTVGRMEPGSVHYMGNPLKFYWYIFYAIGELHALSCVYCNVFKLQHNSI